MICLNDEHFLNAVSSINTTDVGIFISFNEVQLLNINLLIKIIGDCNDISAHDEHPLKANFLITIVGESIDICDNDKQNSKAC